ncbi:uncharacterized protein F5147DRAFT_650080 [Suillus discolor]|uniref:Uncharacterized protein n=1 Tax=Suillus discolor TaxID=1912936 RepID=A0A9P7FEX0_9AGAM|nr:uncharacterized protein F5147DRAFT_650080 [Suillus discolor]KAG2114294.1 hypothetical protein F5147DRAFT_650080 [Suillus discolor]
MIISVAAMASVAVASDDLIINPGGLPCDDPNSVGCSTGIKGWNNDNDFGYICGPYGTIDAYEPCSCQNCCVVTDGVFSCYMMCARGHEGMPGSANRCLNVYGTHRAKDSGATVRAKYKSRTTDQVGLLKHPNESRVKQSWWPGFRGGAPPSRRKNDTILKRAGHQQHQFLRHTSIQHAEPP